MATLIHERLRELRQGRGWSVSTLSRQTVRPGYEGVGEKTIEAIERNPGRIPDADIMDALAAAFGLPAEEVFYEYPVAAARRAARATRAAAQLRRERHGPRPASGQSGDAQETPQ